MATPKFLLGLNCQQCGEVHMKRNNTYRGYLEFESEFDHQLACWAVNHNGWAKFQAWNRKVAKKREKRAAMKDIERDIETYDQPSEENI